MFWLKNSRTKQNKLIWPEKCLRQSGTFQGNPKTYRLKQNVLNWFKLGFLVKQIVSVLALKFWDETNQFDLVKKLSSKLQV